MDHAIAKVVGADTELGNFVQGGGERASRDGTGHRAARLLLREIDGVPGAGARGAARWRRDDDEDDAGGDGAAGRRRHRGLHGRREGGDDGHALSYNPQDWGRRFLASNGGCAYVDLGHLEVCTPETLGARDHVAAHHASLLLAREACEAANAKLPESRRIVVLANNSDGHGNSWGGHLSVLLTRGAYQRVFERLYPGLFYLAAFQVSSILYTGQGKVGAENGRPATAYQLTQRGDFFETLLGPQTTFHRPIVNARDESLCGDRAGSPGLARLHVIFFDTTLGHVSTFLKVGTVQIVAAMIEAGEVNPRLILEDPLAALTVWGHDPELRARARLADGTEVTAAEHQWLFLEDARRFAAAGGTALIPEAESILALWEDTLARLHGRDLDSLAARLDWVMKLALLERVRSRSPRLAWDSPEVKQLDLLFASLDPSEGLYWKLAAAGAVERLVSAEQIERFRREPPQDTRAWTRAMLLRTAGKAAIARVDWDEVRLRDGLGSPGGRAVRLDDPTRLTRRDVEPLLGRGDLDPERLLRAVEAASAIARATHPGTTPLFLPTPRGH
jgi:proteasome accessory factor A